MIIWPKLRIKSLHFAQNGQNLPQFAKISPNWSKNDPQVNFWQFKVNFQNFNIRICNPSLRIVTTVQCLPSVSKIRNRCTRYASLMFSSSFRPVISTWLPWVGKLSRSVNVLCALHKLRNFSTLQNFIIPFTVFFQSLGFFVDTSSFLFLFDWIVCAIFCANLFCDPLREWAV